MNKDASSPATKRGASAKIGSASLKATTPFGTPSSTFTPLSTLDPSTGLGDVKGLASQALKDLATTFEFEIPIQMPRSMSSPIFEIPLFENLMRDGEVNPKITATLHFDFVGEKPQGWEIDAAFGEEEVVACQVNAGENVKEIGANLGNKANNTAHEEGWQDAPLGSVDVWGGEDDNEAPFAKEIDEDAKARSSLPYSLLTTISGGKTTSFDVGEISKRVYIPSLIPSSFGDDTMSSLLEGGIPLGSIVGEGINLGDMDHATANMAN